MRRLSLKKQGSHTRQLVDRRTELILERLEERVLLSGGVDHVAVDWVEDGQAQEHDVPGGDTYTIYPDNGTDVDVAIYRSDQATSPYNYYVSDFNNGDTHHKETTGSWCYFGDVAGPLDTQLWAYVNTTADRVDLRVFWDDPEYPDLAPSNTTVGGSTVADMDFEVGQTVEVKTIVWNNGLGSAKSSDLAYYLTDSRNESELTSSNRWETDGVSSLGHDEGDPEDETYTFQPDDVGARYFAVEADYDHDVDEDDNEDNNVDWWGPFELGFRHFATWHAVRYAAFSLSGGFLGGKGRSDAQIKCPQGVSAGRLKNISPNMSRLAAISISLNVTCGFSYHGHWQRKLSGSSTFS